MAHKKFSIEALIILGCLLGSKLSCHAFLKIAVYSTKAENFQKFP